MPKRVAAGDGDELLEIGSWCARFDQQSRVDGTSCGNDKRRIARGMNAPHATHVCQRESDTLCRQKIGPFQCMAASNTRLALPRDLNGEATSEVCDECIEPHDRGVIGTQSGPVSCLRSHLQHTERCKATQ